MSGEIVGELWTQSNEGLRSRCFTLGLWFHVRFRVDLAMFSMLCRVSGGRMTRPPLGKGLRGTSKKLGAFWEVLFALVLLCFEDRKTSKKFLRNLSLV